MQMNALRTRQVSHVGSGDDHGQPIAGGDDLLGRCKQKQRGLRGLLCRWPSITEWEIYITTQGPVSEMTYTVSSGTLNSSIPYHTIPYHSMSKNVVTLRSGSKVTQGH